MSEQAKYCSNCGRKLLPGEKFCRNCGTPTASLSIPPNEDLDTGSIPGFMQETASHNTASAAPAQSQPTPAAAPKQDISETQQQRNLQAEQMIQSIRSHQPQPVESEEYSEEEPPEHKPHRFWNAVLIILLALLLAGACLLGLSYLFRKQLTPFFEKSLPINLPLNLQLDIPWLHDTSDSAGSEAGTAATASASASATATAASSAAAGDVLSQAMQEKYGASLSTANYEAVTSLSINGTAVTLGSDVSAAAATQTGTVDLSSLSKFTKLNELSLYNIKTLNFPTTALSSITKLKIVNCTVGTAASGIQNFSGLQELTIENTDLQDLSKIAAISGLKKLTADNNKITATDSIKTMKSLSDCTLYGNPIKDYRGLANVATVNIWGSSTDADSIAQSARDANGARQIQVLVSNLRIRTSASSASDSNQTGKYAKENSYYYILDESTDSSANMTWYKIGNNLWIASQEGTWTKLYE